MEVNLAVRRPKSPVKEIQGRVPHRIRFTGSKVIPALQIKFSDVQNSNNNMLTAIALYSTLLLGAPATPTIQDMIPKGFRDASFTAFVVSGNPQELAKINRDFAQSYRFRSSMVRTKEPFMVRAESTVEDSSILFIVNGPRRLVRIPRSNINMRENLATKPGKRQTVFDFGFLTPSLFDDYYQAKFVRTDRATKDEVFDVTYVPRLKDGTRHRVWINPDRRLMVKREWYSQIDGRLMATFSYEDAKQFDGVWLPTRIVVRNSENKIAGTSRYDAVRVNSGLDTDIFRVD